MAIKIENLNIERFRGIHNLEIEDLNHINIIAGDNNSGKTSVLEAILLLRNPNDFTNILRIARMRDTSILFSGTPIYENFINLFPKDSSNLTIELNAKCNGEIVSYILNGVQKKIMMEPEDVLKKLYPAKKSHIINDLDSDAVEVEAFKGTLECQMLDKVQNIDIDIDEYATTSGREIKRKNYMNIVYLSPIDHVRGYIFDKILRNDAYKEICIRILQLFDKDIEDLLILRNEENKRTTEYIKHSKLGNMPISTYGDGIKKVLSLANAIAQAAGGILLIDEVETAIHSKYYDDIFRFLVKASLEFDVQVFITTHSIEAIDALLSTQDYNYQTENDYISVITFKKDLNKPKTYSRVLSGRHVFTNREQFGFEVRIWIFSFIDEQIKSVKWEESKSLDSCFKSLKEI